MNSEAILEAVNKAKDNNQKAFGFLFETFWDYLYRYLFKKTKNENQAEDIAVRTFAKAFDKIETFDPKYSFGTWLTIISKHIHIDQHRKEISKNQLDILSYNKETHSSIEDESPSPEDLLIKTQNLSFLLQKIKTLKEDYKTIIHLRYFEELSYKEISIRLNSPLNTVKVTLLRAKKILFEKIKADER